MIVQKVEDLMRVLERADAMYLAWLTIDRAVAVLTTAAIAAFAAVENSCSDLVVF